MRQRPIPRMVQRREARAEEAAQVIKCGSGVKICTVSNNESYFRFKRANDSVHTAAVFQDSVYGHLG